MIDTYPGIPPPLREIYESIDLSRSEPPNKFDLMETWEKYVDQLRTQIPDINIEAEGEIVHWGELSPGCQACKAGSWDCIFMTMKCNLNCEFCYSPQALRTDYIGSVFGATPEQIAENHARTAITGISFSGGEPFLDPQKLIWWVAWFKEHFPEKYFWVYTNGLLPDECSMSQLGEVGLDEIRFNMAASGYIHPLVMGHLAQAVRCIPNVTVEIPAIPEHETKLLSSLKTWVKQGVKFLNLHELILEPGTRSAGMHGKRRPVFLPDGHFVEINPESRFLTLKVMKKVREDNLPLAVNDCSVQGKLRQLRGRRRNLAPLAKASYEQLVGDTTLESCCVYRNRHDYFFCSVDSIPEIRFRFPDHKIVKISREAPLSLDGKRRWIACEEY